MAIRNTLVLAVTAASLALSTAAFAADATTAPAAAAPAAATTTTTTTTAPAAAVAKSAELKDGTKIEITGDMVEVVGKDGKKSPAPDAVHELKDGSKITTKGGKIVK